MSQSSLIINLFVLKNWGKFPYKEGVRLARWATSANYAFRSDAAGHLILQNPNNGKAVFVEREVNTDGNPEYYFRFELRGKMKKKKFTYELQSHMLKELFHHSDPFPKEYLNISIPELEG